MNNLIITTADELTAIIKSILTEFQSAPTEKPQSETDTLMKPKDVCELLRISNGTLFSWKKQGKIPFRRLGRRIFFVQSDVLNAMKKINAGGL
jgi:excisionase family DNA binding protein